MRAALVLLLSVVLLAAGAAPAVAAAGPTPPASPYSPKKRTTLPPLKPRIVGGYIPPAGMWPWMAAVQLSTARAPQLNDYQRQFCGGVLIHPRIVATAAHCMKESSAADWRVLLGRHDLLGSGGEAIDVVGLRVHPAYADSSYLIRNDVALLILARPAATQPAQLLPREMALYEGDHATVMGWGWRAIDLQGASRILRAANVPLRGMANCQADYAAYPWRVDPSSTICAGFREGGNNTCKGDSGGPLMVLDRTNVWRLVGLVSWAHACAAASYPTVFAYLGAPQLRQFVEATMAELTPAPGAPAPAPAPSAPQPPPTGPAPGGGDVVEPRITAWLVGARLRPRFKALLRYSVSEPATITLVLQRRSGGQWHPVTGVGSLSAHAGPGQSALRSRLGRGPHRLLVRATDGAGHSSPLYAFPFRIRR